MTVSTDGHRRRRNGETVNNRVRSNDGWGEFVEYISLWRIRLHDFRWVGFTLYLYTLIIGNLSSDFKESRYLGSPFALKFRFERPTENENETFSRQPTHWPWKKKKKKLQFYWEPTTRPFTFIVSSRHIHQDLTVNFRVLDWNC